MYSSKTFSSRFILILLFINLLLPLEHSWADPIAKLFSKQGSVEVKNLSSNTWHEVDLQSTFNFGDSVRTAANSRAALLFSDGIMVRLNERSAFEFESAAGAEKGKIKIDEGKAYFFSRQQKDLPEIDTPTVSASIRGTEFAVAVSAGQTSISVIDGHVECENKFGKVSLTNGEEAVAGKGQAPSKRLMVNSTDAVQWALYYPSPMSPNDFPEFRNSNDTKVLAGISALESGDLENANQYFSGSDWRDALGRAMILQRKGNVQGSLKELFLVKVNVPEIELYKSSLLLSLGKADEAVKILQSLVGANTPGLEAGIAAEAAIIGLVQNDKVRMRGLIAHARELDEGSSFVAIASSYVYQSEFDLKSAGQTIDAALQRDPNNAWLVTRKAELLMSHGDAKSAYELSIKAAQLLPYESYPFAVAGFASLSLSDTEQASSLFEKASQLESASGLAFLGLGLSKIKNGDLEAGRLDLQRAAHLEPTVALYRSYLGKAYFEEENENMAEREYSRSINLDPKDPTPFLYRSFLNLSKNRPVDALSDIEDSIELNDNRAVYRSQLLLDQDKSVRSVSLAQVFNELGFKDAARIEAIKSLSQDYSNPSAHFFLANSYEDGDDFIQSQISEFLIARLLSPVNFNAILPTASSSTSLNEYSAFFDRPLTRTSVSTTGRTQDNSVDTRATETVLSKDWGFALDYEYNYTHGYRNNDFNHEHILYSSAQYQLSPDDTLLLDTNFDLFDAGDPEVDYDPHSNNDQSLELDDYLVRLGFNHRFDAGTHWIGQILYNHSEFGFGDPTFQRLILANSLQGGELIDSNALQALSIEQLKFKSQGVRADTQILHDNSLVSLVSGIGILDSTQKQNDSATTIESDDFPYAINLNSMAENGESSKRLFTYSTWHLQDWLDLHAGLSYSYLHLSGSSIQVPYSESINTLSQWNPKAGVSIYATPSTTLRSAYFETIGNSGIRELEVIEPTTVAGFNQVLFDPFPGTRTQNYAVGVDQKFAKSTYFGVEAVRRALTRLAPVPYDIASFDFDSGEFISSENISVDGKSYNYQDDFRGYLNQVLAKKATASIEYNYLIDEDRDNDAESRTQRYRTSLNYFEENGFFAFTSGTWRNQSLDNFDEVYGVPDGSKDFWIFDTGVGYRLPKRHGSVALVLNNILDSDFNYIPTGTDPLVFPGIGGTVVVSVNF